jgi:hypothetical protein
MSFPPVPQSAICTCNTPMARICHKPHRTETTSVLPMVGPTNDATSRGGIGGACSSVLSFSGETQPFSDVCIGQAAGIA